MKLIGIADTHFGFKFGRTAEAKRYSSDMMFESFNYIIQLAKKERVDAIIHGGDVFDRSKPPKSEINRVYIAIEQLLLNDIGFIVTPGNHDRARLPESLLMYFEKQLFQFNQLSSFKFREINFIGFPFEYNDPRRVFRQALKKVNQKPSVQHIIMCHQLFSGATFGPHKFTFTYQRDVISPRTLPNNLHCVLSGHIHKAQALFNNRVLYPGSTERTSFVEAIEDKTALIFEMEDDYFSFKTIKLPTREFKVIELDVRDNRISFSEIDDLIPNPRIPCLVRLFGRELNENEIQRLFVRYPAYSYPFLFFSPNRVKITLNRLYSAYTNDIKISV